MKATYRIVELIINDEVKYRVDKLDKFFGIPIGWDKELLFTFVLKLNQKTGFDNFPMMFDGFSAAENWILKQAKSTKFEVKCVGKVMKEIEIEIEQ